jgi:hypothetical protein
MAFLIWKTRRDGHVTTPDSLALECAMLYITKAFTDGRVRDVSWRVAHLMLPRLHQMVETLRPGCQTGWSDASRGCVGLIQFSEDNLRGEWNGCAQLQGNRSTRRCLDGVGNISLWPMGNSVPKNSCVKLVTVIMLNCRILCRLTARLGIPVEKETRQRYQSEIQRG